MENNNKALFILFGSTGDLAKRKLYPSIFKLFEKGYLADAFAVIGTARRPWTDDYFHQIIIESLDDIDATLAKKQEFASHFYYQAHDVTDSAHYIALRELANKLDDQYHIGGNRIYYMAMAPTFFGTIAAHLKSEKIITNSGFNRLIIEKPFGHDYNSAAALNEEIRQAFDENQIYRIDHYLGKEMVQNIAALRFGNSIFESLWNSRYIDNVQVTLAESLGVEERAGYYETSGALRDMVQNHILQIVTLLAMEPPVSFKDTDIRAEKIKALNSLHFYQPSEVADNFVRGQYGPGNDAKTKNSYREEDGVAEDSTVETFVAGKIMIDNFRWSGVPFYIRTGKRLAKKSTQISIVFKKVPVDIFGQSVAEPTALAPNVLTIYVEPEEGFSLELNAKEVGQGFATQPSNLSFQHNAKATVNSPEAYERLILDALNGDATNFTHWDEVAQSWKFIDIIRQAWDQSTPEFPNYVSGSMGPKASEDLLGKTKREWFFKGK